MPSLSHSKTSDLLRKVRKIEIRTKALSHQIFAGEYHSAFKGRGMAFSEVREYQWGDDVRSMDWNVTARLRAPYVKVFEEARSSVLLRQGGKVHPSCQGTLSPAPYYKGDA